VHQLCFRGYGVFSGLKSLLLGCCPLYFGLWLQAALEGVSERLHDLGGRLHKSPVVVEQA
jgi:hypothetical protein